MLWGSGEGDQLPHEASQSTVTNQGTEEELSSTARLGPASPAPCPCHPKRSRATDGAGAEWTMAAVRACSAAPPHSRRAEIHAFHEKE